MSIEKRGVNSWRVQTQIRDADGSLRWIRKTIRLSSVLTEKQQLREARIEEAKIIEEARRLSFTESSPTLQAFSSLYLKRHCAESSPTTIDGYMIMMDVHILPFLGDTRLENLTTEQLNQWMDWLRDKRMARSSIRKIYGLLLSMLNEAVRWDYLTFNPLTKVSRPKKEQRDTASLTEEQFRALIDAVSSEENVSHRCGVLLAAMCGLRIGEVCALKLSDVDFEKSEIYVHRSAKYTSVTGAFVADTKTEASRRVIVCPEIVMQALADSRDELERISLRDDYIAKNTYIVHTTHGASLNTDSLRKWWISFSEQIGLAGTRFHDLRHTHASLLIANGIDVVTVSKRLGHASPTTTLQTYAHALRQRDQDSANAIASLINQKK